MFLIALACSPSFADGVVVDFESYVNDTSPIARALTPHYNDSYLTHESYISLTARQWQAGIALEIYTPYSTGSSSNYFESPFDHFHTLLTANFGLRNQRLTDSLSYEWNVEAGINNSKLGETLQNWFHNYFDYPLWEHRARSELFLGAYGGVTHIRATGRATIRTTGYTELSTIRHEIGVATHLTLPVLSKGGVSLTATAHPKLFLRGSRILDDGADSRTHSVFLHSNFEMELALKKKKGAALFWQINLMFSPALKQVTNHYYYLSTNLLGVRLYL